MKTIALTSIIIKDNRQRRNFTLKELNELSEDIKKNGLFHAIMLRREGDQLVLVSGERRCRAIADIHALGETFKHDMETVPLGHIPYTERGDVSELEWEEAELSENINRADLTWQERASATARLSILRGKQAVAAGTPIPTTARIAEEVRGSSQGVHQELTRREIIVAKHFDDPEVKGAESVDKAYKILKRKEDTQKRVELAAKIGATYSAATAHEARNEDSLLWMTQTAADQFDVVLTDPPYGIDADTFGDSGGKAAGAHQYDDSYESWQKSMKIFAKESYRVCKSQAHLYAFCDITRFEEFKAILDEEGWNVFRTPIIWHKPNGSRTPWVDFGPQRKYEIILYANKGRKLVTRIYPDVVTYTADENLGHNAQKPVALYVDLLRRSVGAGDKVLDPFSGSGPIFPAATELKCRATGIEIDPAAYALGVRRLEQLDAEPELVGLV